MPACPLDQSFVRMLPKFRSKRNLGTTPPNFEEFCSINTQISRNKIAKNANKTLVWGKCRRTGTHRPVGTTNSQPLRRYRSYIFRPRLEPPPSVRAGWAGAPWAARLGGRSLGGQAGRALLSIGILRYCSLAHFFRRSRYFPDTFPTLFRHFSVPFWGNAKIW